MGWLRDIFTGCDYRLTFHDGVRKVRYTLETGTSMTLIGPGLDDGPRRELHRYERPLAVIMREDGGPVTLTSNDKGRWFVTLSDLACSQFPTMTFQCRNRSEAEGIVRRADKLRGNGPLL
ncbi:MAG: hypothetical protein HFJ73_01700 [Eggerthellaceae bacterium]|jgi:hypothetical protein|nr:hypothetical protein [Eggerthellaceae bacterium]